MSEKYRLKHKDGSFAADNYNYTPRVDWLCEDYVEKLRLAAQLPTAPLELKTVVKLLEASVFEEGDALVLPHTDKTKAAFDKDLARGTMLIVSQKQGYHYLNTHEHLLVTLEEQLQKKHMPTKRQKWVRLNLVPYFRWIETPGKALMRTHEEWLSMITLFDTVQKTMRLLPAAVKQASKLGFKIEPWEMPRLKKLPTALQKVTEAEIEAFNPTEAYLNRECYAVFRGSPDKSGFLDHKGELQLDLGAARLYPSVKDAKRGIYQDGAIVKVEVVPRSFEIIGSSEYLNDLKQTMSAREAIELEKALEMANVDQLRAALKAKEPESNVTQENMLPAGHKKRL